nr:hypothetical protein [Deltaproteobacteria bacterium]
MMKKAWVSNCIAAVIVAAIATPSRADDPRWVDDDPGDRIGPPRETIDGPAKTHKG